MKHFLKMSDIYWINTVTKRKNYWFLAQPTDNSVSND